MGFEDWWQLMERMAPLDNPKIAAKAAAHYFEKQARELCAGICLSRMKEHMAAREKAAGDDREYLYGLAEEANRCENEIRATIKF